jgi:thiamine pyrophosphate-dependent acetolactate synthase large subunit-like protein
VAQVSLRATSFGGAAHQYRQADARAEQVLPDDAIVVADGGFAAHWGSLLLDTKRAGRHLVPDRGFASIGYGVPGGIGAQLGAGPERRVVSLTGDGGFNMSLGDLETARRTGANFVAIVFNNAASGYVKALQHSVYGEGSYQSSDLVELNYAEIAKGFGCLGIRVENPDDISGALREAWRTDRRRRSSTRWSPVTPRECCLLPTTAPSKSRKATGQYNAAHRLNHATPEVLARPADTGAVGDQLLFGMRGSNRVNSPSSGRNEHSQ